jgi:hypothetical protein
MNTARKKTKAKSYAKSSNVKAEKATASAATATTADTSATPATTNAAASGDYQDVGTLIKNLDVASLHNDDITSILLHCASALNLRKVIDSPGATMANSSASYCYTKSGDDPTVSIWSGGFKVGESSEEDARSSGIPPCG